MFLRIKNVLNAPEIARLVELSRELRFIDGRVSNPANQTKDNLQADPSDAKSAHTSVSARASNLDRVDTVTPGARDAAIAIVPRSPGGAPAGAWRTAPPAW